MGGWRVEIIVHILKNIYYSSIPPPPNALIHVVDGKGQAEQQEQAPLSFLPAATAGGPASPDTVGSGTAHAHGQGRHAVLEGQGPFPSVGKVEALVQRVGEGGGL